MKKRGKEGRSHRTQWRRVSCLRTSETRVERKSAIWRSRDWCSSRCVGVTRIYALWFPHSIMVYLACDSSYAVPLICGQKCNLLPFLPLLVLTFSIMTYCRYFRLRNWQINIDYYLLVFKINFILFLRLKGRQDLFNFNRACALFRNLWHVFRASSKFQKMSTRILIQNDKGISVSL